MMILVSSQSSTITSFSKPASSSSLSSSSSSTTYRPAVILPGLGNNSGDYKTLQLSLKEQYGVESVVANVSRLDWFRNAAGLVDANYWKGTLRPRPVLDWYLKRVDEAVLEAQELAQGRNITIIGHSAGGWLARLYMEEFGLSNISLLLTLGTPHRPPPKGLPGVIDQTRGLLYYVEDNCRKAVYTPGLKYVCIAGRYIQGARILGKPDANLSIKSAILVDSNEEPASEVVIVNNNNELTSPVTFRAQFVGQGYKQVCGRADVWGDGVVPEESAHLDGALNISLEGVYHSPVGSDESLRPWYGSPSVLDHWVQHLIN